MSAILPGQRAHDAFMREFRGVDVPGAAFTEPPLNIQRCWAAAEAAGRELEAPSTQTTCGPEAERQGTLAGDGPLFAAKGDR